MGKVDVGSGRRGGGGIGRFEGGIGRLEGGIGTLAGGLGRPERGIGKLEEGIGSVEEGVERLEGGIGPGGGTGNIGGEGKGILCIGGIPNSGGGLNDGVTPAYGSILARMLFF